MVVQDFSSCMAKFVEQLVKRNLKWSRLIATRYRSLEFLTTNLSKYLRRFGFHALKGGLTYYYIIFEFVFFLFDPQTIEHKT